MPMGIRKILYSAPVDRVLFLVGSAKYIVGGGAVKVSKPDQNMGGNVVFSGFIFGVSGLGHAKHLCNFPLRKVSVFTQIANSSVHGITPYIFYLNLFQVIGFNLKQVKMRGEVIVMTDTIESLWRGTLYPAGKLMVMISSWFSGEPSERFLSVFDEMPGGWQC